MAKALVKVGDKVMATGGKLLTAESGSLLKPVLDISKNCYQMFREYQGDNMNELIQYNDTENVENFGSMFSYCINLTNIPQLDTSNGTSFSSMFSYCKSLTNIPQLDTSNGTSFSSMFYGCTKLTQIPPLNTSKGTSFGSMFRDCINLTNIPQLDISNAKGFDQLFYGCENLIYIPPLNNRIAEKNFNHLFYNCRKLPKIDVALYNSSNTNDSTDMFYYCYTLKALIIRSFGDNYVLHSTSFSGAYKMLGQTNSWYNPNGEQGYVYIPREYMNIIPNETNWSILQFRALEDYIIPNEDGTIDLINGVFDDEKAGIVYETD